jgi:hypothetical protein
MNSQRDQTVLTFRSLTNYVGSFPKPKCLEPRIGLDIEEQPARGVPYRLPILHEHSGRFMSASSFIVT